MNINRLNININGVSSPGFSGDTSLFEELTKLVGSDIPSDYIKFIMRADGGHPEIGCFKIIANNNNENLFDVDWFYSVGNLSLEKVEDALFKWGGVLGKYNLPIGRDAGGNQIYLNLEDQVPSVWLYLHDEGGVRLRVSNDFLEFIDSLIINPDFI